jgi:predicted Zn-dependent peptidase
VEGEALAEFGPRLVDQLADILLRPSFPASELDRLKNDRIRQLSIAMSDPNTQALEKFRSLLYAGHVYGRMFPTEAMLTGYTLAQVKAFYEAHMGAGRAHVYVAGKFDRREMEDAIRKAFGSWPAGEAADVAPPEPVRGRALHVVNRPGAPQSMIYLGLPVINPSHPDYRALLVTNMLLGGSFSSRITANIRENKGYTYSPNSSVSSRYRDAYWAETASVTTAVTGPALKEILYEINRLQAEPPAVEELRAIQNYAAGIFTLQNSSPAGIISLLAFLRLHGLPDSYLTEYVKTITAVTPEDVQRMAMTHLKDEEMLIVIAGDRKAIEKQLVPYGRIAP